ncbi:MAG: CZB domain-containing protein [Candidatus Accumulibacter sp.]|nr:CZB domain-containing protein [Candidatus Accumulibacter conexus]
MDRVRDIEEAIGAHARWMSELRQAVLDAHSGADVEAIRADDRCDFGQWLYGPRLSAEDRATESYDEVRRLHAEFHQLAATVVERAAAGEAAEAYTLLYGDYVTLSGRLALAMRAWQARLLQGIVSDA